MSRFVDWQTFHRAAGRDFWAEITSKIRKLRNLVDERIQKELFGYNFESRS